VKNLYGRIRGVHALSAGAAGSANFDPNLIWTDLEFDLFGDRQNGNGCGRGVDAALGFGRGDALDPMDAAFLAHGGENGLAAYFENNLFEASQFGGAGRKGFEFPASCFRITAVHAEQIGRENGRFGSAGAGSDFDDGIAVFIRIGRKNGAKDFGFGSGFVSGEVGSFFLGHLAHFGIGGAGQEGRIFL
jgi:hypothetical protein